MDTLLKTSCLNNPQGRPPRYPRGEHEGDPAHALPRRPQGLGEDAGEDDGGEYLRGLGAILI